jgi:amidophosphoribosyltransferase
MDTCCDNALNISDNQHNDLSPDRPTEECGVFGIYGSEDASNLAYLGLYALQHRGQESAGIASSDGEHIYRFAGMGKVGDVFNEQNLSNLHGSMAIAHNRYSTTGSSFLRNAQPIRVETRYGAIVLSHNGNLVNTAGIRSRLVEKGHIFQTSVDTEVIAHLIAMSGLENFKDALISALKQIEGAYSLLIMTKDTIYAVRDPNGFRPLVLGKLGDAWVLASETTSFDIIDAAYDREVKPGELIEISRNGLTSSFPFEKRKESLCVFEYIYFARPDSIIFGHSVHDMRIQLGRMLARQMPVEADLVVAIPDSSVHAALGYSYESGIRYDIAMIRGHYIGRTFIEPSQKIRDFGAKIKYNVVKSAVKDKRIVVVDDSIMRGTTMRKIIKMFRNAGAKEVHIRISAPPTKFPCFYGIDIPSHNELIAATHTIEEIRKYLRVESISYLTNESLLAAVDKPDMHFCTACFDGQYPVQFEQQNASDKTRYEDGEQLEFY